METKFQVGDIPDVSHLAHPQNRLCNGRKQLDKIYGSTGSVFFEGILYKELKNYKHVYVSNSAEFIRITVYGVKKYTINGNHTYAQITIGKITKSVHRLVAETFVDNPKKLPCVNHKNGDKQDNRAENLEWMTFSENIKHSYDVLKRTPPHTKLNTEDIIKILNLYNNNVSPEVISNSFDVSIHVIRDILNFKSARARKINAIKESEIEVEE